MQINIAADFSGERLDKALAVLLPHFSRATLQKAIKSGQLTVNGEAWTDPAKKISAACVAELTYSEEPTDIVGEDIPIDVVFEDEHIVVIDKPAGLVCHPAPGHRTGTLVHALVNRFRLSDVDAARPGIIHRLDKDTSGLMLVAKTNQAHFAFAKLFAEHKGNLIRRRYICFVFGNPKSGRLETQIRRHPTNRQQFIAAENGGKKAVTLYKTLATRYFSATKCISEVECELLTGRTHQIRVHMRHLGYPIIGDPVYGRKKIEPVFPDEIRFFPRQALHSSNLDFRHPITNANLSFTSPLPEDMTTLQLFAM